MNEKEPVGELKFHHVETKQNAHAIYIDVYFTDESGNMWMAHMSSFTFNLTPVL